jgi:outer membrane receptor protein involved in Fe transport
MTIDNYRLAEIPRIVDTTGKVFRILGGLRGVIGTDWDWDSAIIYSKAKRNDVTHNRVSNTLLQEALSDPTSAAYNPFGGGVDTNIERALVDVRRDSTTDLKLIDFKISNIGLFNIWGGEVGFLAGAEYRKESFKDDRDDRLDGTIVFTDWEDDTYPFVSDVVNSSPTPDNHGSRHVTSLFSELALPVTTTLDVQLAVRYEDFSDVGSTWVPKIAFGWRATDWFMLRGSWSEAFRAPNLITVNESLVVRNNTRTDWTCQYAADFGGDPDQDTLDCSNTIQRRATGSKELKPEKSTNTSIGIVLNPVDSLTMTFDYWSIKKKDTIGLFGEENHTLLDLLDRIEQGVSNCDSVGNPLLGRSEVDDDNIPFYLAAGICPAGDLDYVNDRYANLDTRKVQGYDWGVYYDLDSDIGDWTFTWVGTHYTKYDQVPGSAATLLLDAQNAGIIPANYPVAGFDDLRRINGNQDTKMNARVRWRKNGWGASVAWFYLSNFIQDSLDISNDDGTLTRWVVPSVSTWNLSADYRFDLWQSSTRVRLGINNVGNKRAPLADRYFGYFSDAHRDYGRSYYIDFQMSW